MSPRRVTLTKAATVPPRRARWLYDGRVPLGTVSILAGEPGLGKSTLLSDLAAGVSKGTLPGDLTHNPAGVLIASAEDDPAATLVPRLMAAEADLERVHFVTLRVEADGQDTPGALTLPDDVPALLEEARSVGARLLVLDPVVAYLDGQINAHRDQHVRRVLAPLAEHAARMNLAVLAVLHLNKTSGGTALNRVGGSVGFGGAARSVLLLARDPEDPEGDRGPSRVLAHVKCNLGPKAESLLGRVVAHEVQTPEGPASVGRWQVVGRSDHAADDLVDPEGETPSAREEAAAFLREQLDAGPVAARAILARARDAGISERTLKRAKKQIGAVSEKGEDGWSWVLPPDNPIGTLGTVGTLESVKGAKGAKETTPARVATLADTLGGEGAAVDAIRDAFAATELDVPPVNAICWDLGGAP